MAGLDTVFGMSCLAYKRPVTHKNKPPSCPSRQNAACFSAKTLDFEEVGANCLTFLPVIWILSVHLVVLGFQKCPARGEISVPRSVLDAIKMGIWNFEPETVEGSRYDATRAMPGTREKLSVMASRIREGLPLWHTEDRCSFEDSEDLR